MHTQLGGDMDLHTQLLGAGPSTSSQQGCDSQSSDSELIYSVMINASGSDDAGSRIQPFSKLQTEQPSTSVSHENSDVQTATQIAFRRRTDVGYWSHGRQILPTLGRRWADVVLPTNTLVGCLYILPTLGRRWANVGPTLACQPTLRLEDYILPTLGQRWANGGFLFKMAASNNRGFGET